MNTKQQRHISKFLSLVLRHQPQKIDLELDANGWAKTNELIKKSNDYGIRFTEEDLKHIVETNDKQRFSFNESGTQIRANQGHSLTAVNLELKAVQPPEVLYHGTVEKFMQEITSEGLKKMSRQHVHLSRDIETAKKVGGRRGKPVILIVDACEMFKQGYEFYQSANGVWLTDRVPAEFLKLKQK